MSKQAKFITSHRSRVKRAEEYRQNSPMNINIFDREAIVEFYLLEDIVRQYSHNKLEAEKAYRTAETEYGKLAMTSIIEKFNAIIDIFNSAVEVAQAQLIAGNYKAVWKSIPERPLMMAAGSMKHLNKLADIAKELLKDLMDEALSAAGIKMSFDEYLEDANAHDKNVRTVRGLPSPIELKEVIDALDVLSDIPDLNKSKLNPKIN